MYDYSFLIEILYTTSWVTEKPLFYINEWRTTSPHVIPKLLCDMMCRMLDIIFGVSRCKF